MLQYFGIRQAIRMRPQSPPESQLLQKVKYDLISHKQALLSTIQTPTLLALTALA
jgi:hypothetical protein